MLIEPCTIENFPLRYQRGIGTLHHHWRLVRLLLLMLMDAPRRLVTRGLQIESITSLAQPVEDLKSRLSTVVSCFFIAASRPAS